MLVILDTCNIGLAKHPSGGFVLKIADVEGLPENCHLMLPVEGKEAAYELVDGIIELLGPRVHTSDLADLRKELSNGS